MSETVEPPVSLDCRGCGAAALLESTRCGCGVEFDVLRRASRAALENLERGQKLRLSHDKVADPVESGFRRSRLGRRVGQQADYRMLASRLKEGDGRELHLREYADGYALHVDRHPARNPRHVVDDAPEVGVAAGVAAFAAVGIVAVASTFLGGEDE